MQLRQAFAQVRGLLHLAVQHGKLPGDHVRQGSTGLVQVSANFRQRQSETTQCLDLMQTGNLVAAVQAIAVFGAR
ncbi:hypothetical protein D3C86_989420 [compost metagenome]